MIRSLDAGALARYLDEIGERPDHSLRRGSKPMRATTPSRCEAAAAASSPQADSRRLDGTALF